MNRSKSRCFIVTNRSKSRYVLLPWIVKNHCMFCCHEPIKRVDGFEQQRVLTSHLFLVTIRKQMFRWLVTEQAGQLWVNLTNISCGLIAALLNHHFQKTRRLELRLTIWYAGIVGLEEAFAIYFYLSICHCWNVYAHAGCSVTADPCWKTLPTHELLRVCVGVPVKTVWVYTNAPQLLVCVIVFSCWKPAAAAAGNTLSLQQLICALCRDGLAT